MWESEGAREEVKSNVVAMLASANISEGFGAGIVLQLHEHSMRISCFQEGCTSLDCVIHLSNFWKGQSQKALMETMLVHEVDHSTIYCTCYTLLIEITALSAPVLGPVMTIYTAVRIILNHGLDHALTPLKLVNYLHLLLEAKVLSTMIEEKKKNCKILFALSSMSAGKGRKKKCDSSQRNCLSGSGPSDLLKNNLEIISSIYCGFTLPLVYVRESRPYEGPFRQQRQEQNFKQKRPQ